MNFSQQTQRESDPFMPSNTGVTTRWKTNALICGVCYECIVEQGIIECCKHDFCFDCIYKWSETENTCPLCKKRFERIQRVLKRKYLGEPSNGCKRRKLNDVICLDSNQEERRVIVQPRNQSDRAEATDNIFVSLFQGLLSLGWESYNALAFVMDFLRQSEEDLDSDASFQLEIAGLSNEEENASESSDERNQEVNSLFSNDWEGLDNDPLSSQTFDMGELEAIYRLREFNSDGEMVFNNIEELKAGEEGSTSESENRKEDESESDNSKSDEDAASRVIRLEENDEFEEFDQGIEHCKEAEVSKRNKERAMAKTVSFDSDSEEDTSEADYSEYEEEVKAKVHRSRGNSCSENKEEGEEPFIIQTKRVTRSMTTSAKAMQSKCTQTDDPAERRIYRVKGHNYRSREEVEESKEE